MFHWIDFVQRYNIPYVEEGPNTASGNINIKCPFCGVSDPSMHMGLSLSTSSWGCWRNQNHRGRKPQRLVMRLLGCSYQRAIELVGYGGHHDLSQFDQLFLEPEPKAKPAEVPELKLLKSFRDIRNVEPESRFLDYLRYDRGFGKYAMDVVRAYDLKCCLTGRWRNRIIIPNYLDNELVGWVGRSIYRRSNARYLALSHEKDKAEANGDPVAPLNVKHTIFNFDDLVKYGDILIIVEGVFDAMKLDAFAQGRGVRATCLYSTSLTNEQIYLLDELLPLYHRKYVLFDRQETQTTLRVSNQLAHHNVGVRFLEKNDDPGSMTQTEIYDFLRSL